MKGPAMFQSILSSLVAAALLFPQPTLQPEPPQLLKRTSQSIAVVEWGDEEHGGYCTGFSVGIVWILTAEHCAPEGEDVLVDGAPAKVVKRNDMLVLLQIEASRYQVLNVEKKRPKVGERTATVGFIYMMPEMTIYRNVAGYCQCEFGEHENMLMDAPAGGGMSGAPVLNEKGDVVGLHQASKGIIGFETTGKDIKDFIDGK
jgi:V8-like Glu-specific endopeptidase